MKRAVFLLAVAGLLAGLSGCTWPGNSRCGTGLINGSCQNAPENCAACSGVCEECGGRGCPHCRHNYVAPNPGPATGAVTYPYYTTRGPRDFLDRNPPSIGP
jgi:hypothetical protein